jgi:hypothetical protein
MFPLRPPIQPRNATLFFLLFCASYAHSIALFLRSAK